MTATVATKTSYFTPASSKELLDIQATIERGYTLKRVRDVTRTYCQFPDTFVFEFLIIFFFDKKLINFTCLFSPNHFKDSNK